ncbi:MAG: hypothetical protein MRK02_09590 [Candidatus Scalindua sp.]|nr:hypothetical protein [Candidatus Scalindua sp.]
MKFETFTIPNNDKEIFIKPAYKEIAGLTALNKERFHSYHFDINGKPFSQFRERVRAETLKKAREYTKRIWSLCTKLEITGDENFFYRNDAYTQETKIIQTGHAPVFVHPGVLIKYALVNNIANKVEGVGLNMIVDNDIFHSNSLDIPNINGLCTTLEKIPFMTRMHGTAFEEIGNTKQTELSSLRKKVLQFIHNPEMERTFTEFMNIMITLNNHIQPYCDLFTFTRHVYLQRFNINNLEIPVSLLCETEPFSEFFLHIVQNLKIFVDIYNTELDRYRKQKNIRSKANPLPDLVRQGDVIELPFWIWGENEPRERLFASVASEGNVNLIYKRDSIVKLNFSIGRAPLENLRKMKHIKDAGLRIRPRAIINTMYARMFVSDLFVHGIGGAKYDLITDEIIKKFFGVEPPGYATISATLHLPYDQYNVSPADADGLRHIIKGMNQHPENYASDEITKDPLMQSMVTEKNTLITAEIHNQQEKQRIFNQLKQLRILMKEKISPLIREKEKELEHLKKKLDYNSLITNREYPFCIYPERVLRELFSLPFSTPP